jgi:hypothetical protein
MKKIAFIFAIALLPALMFAQNSAVDKLFEKYKGKEGVTTVMIGPELFQVMKAMDVEEFENEDIPLDKVSAVKILTIEDEDAFPEVDFYKEIKEDLDVSDYAEIMTVQDGGETVHMWMKAGTDSITEFLLIVGGDDNVLVYITGDFQMEDLEGLAESFGDDIDIDLDL